MHKRYSISVIVPVYNEKALLEKSIIYINKFLAENFNDHEIIIIESGSVDGSSEICDKVAAHNFKIRVIHEGSRNGFGSALKLGYKKAVKDLVCAVTVDLPFPLECIFKALPLFPEYDSVLSFRSEDKRCAYRKLQSFIYNSLVRILLAVKAKHINSSFKMFKRELIQNMRIDSNGWLIDAEILYRLKKRNISCAQIPIPLIDRSEGKSSIKPLTCVHVFKELLYFLRNKDK